MAASDQEHDRLCRACYKVDFNKYLEEETEPSNSLGSWARVQENSRCPSCGLVVHAITANPVSVSSSAEHEVRLWNELSWKLGIEFWPYDRSRSESHSDKFDLRSKAKQCSRTSYRFLVATHD